MSKVLEEVGEKEIERGEMLGGYTAHEGTPEGNRLIPPDDVVVWPNTPVTIIPNAGKPKP